MMVLKVSNDPKMILVSLSGFDIQFTATALSPKSVNSQNTVTNVINV